MKQKESESRLATFDPCCCSKDSRLVHTCSGWSPKAAHIYRPRTLSLAGADGTAMANCFGVQARFGTFIAVK